jgi:hypothetical protein
MGSNTQHLRILEQRLDQLERELQVQAVMLLQERGRLLVDPDEREYPSMEHNVSIQDHGVRLRELTVIRYSTARSGLLKLARRARIT